MLAATDRLTVDPCTPSSRATCARLSGRECCGPWRRNASWYSASASPSARSARQRSSSRSRKACARRRSALRAAASRGPPLNVASEYCGLKRSASRPASRTSTSWPPRGDRRKASSGGGPAAQGRRPDGRSMTAQGRSRVRIKSRAAATSRMSTAKARAIARSRPAASAARWSATIARARAWRASPGPSASSWASRHPAQSVGGRARRACLPERVDDPLRRPGEHPPARRRARRRARAGIRATSGCRWPPRPGHGRRPAGTAAPRRAVGRRRWARPRPCQRCRPLGAKRAPHPGPPQARAPARGSRRARAQRPPPGPPRAARASARTGRAPGRRAVREQWRLRARAGRSWSASFVSRARPSLLQGPCQTP